MGPIGFAPSASHTALAGVLALAAAVWVGGFIALIVVAQAARRTVPPAERVAFFRALGRGYGLVAGVALLVALVTGAVLLVGRPWTGTLIATVTVAGLLVVSTVVGVLQARRMTRLRGRALRDSDDLSLAARIRRTAMRATVLRAGIGGLSLALLALGMVLAG